jgi:type VI secretion system protein ImpF
MLAADSQSGLKPSLLDRLTDPESEGTIGRPGYSVTQMVDSVRRDLENLLNSHLTERAIPAEYVQVKNSIAAYGLPDLVSLHSGGPEASQKIAAALEEAITRFEPRLSNVRVTILEGSNARQLKLEFQIQATLRVDPAPEVSFVTVLTLTTGEASIRRADE